MLLVGAFCGRSEKYKWRKGNGGRENETEKKKKLQRPVLSSSSMEHGSIADSKSSTFSLTDEDHTLANSVRFTLNQDPRVSFTGYSIPHPSDNLVNIRVQTTGDPAKDVFKDALQDLMVMCQHVRGTFDKAVVDFRASADVKEMKIDS